jgi:hypothetical protein
MNLGVAKGNARRTTAAVISRRPLGTPLVVVLHFGTAFGTAKDGVFLEG